MTKAVKKAHKPEFLAEMKAILEEEQVKLQAALDRITDKRHSSLDADAVFPDYGEDEDENAMEVADFASSVSLETEIEKSLRDVQQALIRLEDGTYGVDKYTNELISEDRLRARPTSTTSVESKKTLTQEM